MDIEAKCWFGVIFATGLILLVVCLGVGHAETRSKQLLFKELGIKASYWEAVGTGKEFIEGRLVERGAKCSNKN